MHAADPERRYTGIVSALAGRAILLNGETVVKTRITLTDADDGFLDPICRVFGDRHAGAGRLW